MSQEIVITRLSDSLVVTEFICENYREQKRKHDKVISIENSEQQSKIKQKKNIIAQKSISYTIILSIIILMSPIGGIFLVIVVNPSLTPVSIMIMMLFAVIEAAIVIKSETECVMKKIKKKVSKKL